MVPSNSNDCMMLGDYLVKVKLLCTFPDMILDLPKEPDFLIKSPFSK